MAKRPTTTATLTFTVKGKKQSKKKEVVTMGREIRGPSIERLVKDLRITKAAAANVKQAMLEGKVNETLTRASRAMGAHGTQGPYPGETPAFGFVDQGNINAKTLYYTGKSFQIGSVNEFLRTHTSSRTAGSWKRTSS